MQKLGYDGIEIKGREMVNFTPPNDIKYFKNEQQLKNYYDAVIKNSSDINEEENEYKMSHRIEKDDTSSPLYDMLQSGSVPDDFYTHMHHYDYSRNPSTQAMAIIKNVRNKPEAAVMIYRAVPKGVTTINPGDWVAITKAYAQHHGMSHQGKKFDMPVISKKVKAKDIIWNGNDLNEFAYFPNTNLYENKQEDNIYYHGSKTKFEKFDLINNKTYQEFDIPTWFFTKDIEYAKSYGQYLYIVKLNIDNTFDTSNQNDYKLFINFLKEQNTTKAQKEKILDEQFYNGLPYWTCEDAFYVAKYNKFDSILIQEELEREVLSVAVFDSSVIEIKKIQSNSIHENLRLKIRSILIKESLSSNVTIDLSSQKIFVNKKEAGNFGVYFSKNKEYLNIDKIFINKEFRGQGIGQKAMEKILEYASSKNMIATVTPDSVWGSSVNKLIKWYKSLGFIMNTGKNKDFNHKYLMYKNP